MANWNGLQLTNKGIALQAKVQAGEQLRITKLKLGSGVVPSNTDIKTLTDLITPEQNLGIGAKEAAGEYCKISSTISNTGLEAGYYVRELGVFAQDPDAGEILYMYATDGAPDYLPAGGGSTVISQEFNVMVAVDDAENVAVDIDPSALATMGYVQLQITEYNIEHNADEYAHNDMVGATADVAGKRGMVPAPVAGTQNSFLTGAGTYKSVATTEQAQAGTDDAAPMTALKVKQALEAAGDVIAVGDVVYRPYLKAGYVKANGATVLRSDYPTLATFATEQNLWTTDPTNEPWKYGVGDGATTIVLPDYRNRVIRGGDITTNNIFLNGKLTTGGISISRDGIVAGNKVIQNVAEGTIAEGSKEAVNGGQIFELLEEFSGEVGGSATTIIASDSDSNLEIQDVTQDEDNGRKYQIGLSKNLNLESASFSSDTGDTKASIDSKGMSASDDNSGAAAAVSAKGLTASDGTKTISFTTESINAGGQKIQNVADGTIAEGSKEAVNGGQLNKEVQTRAAVDEQLQQRIDDVERGLDGRFDKLGDRIDKVGAGAAALAALHPLDYDPDDKLNFAVGLGNYRGEQAAALGAFYRPNEVVMFSVGGTMGNDDNMVNLGVSFALDGKRGKAKESRAQLEQKVASMSDELAEVKAQLALLLQQNKEKK